jgi:CubicO group peptidase (beta-lactamase class C family)
LSVDSTGSAMTGVGLATTLRDMARFGETLRCDGTCGATNRFPPPWSPISGAAASLTNSPPRATPCSQTFLSRYVVGHSQRARGRRSARYPRSAPVRRSRHREGGRPFRLSPDRGQCGQRSGHPTRAAGPRPTTAGRVGPVPLALRAGCHLRLAILALHVEHPAGIFGR